VDQEEVRLLPGVRLLVKPIRQSQLWNALTAGGSDAPPAGPSVAVVGAALPAAETVAPLAARLLVVEDNIVNQKVVLRQLARLGYTRVDAVANGLEAVSAVAAARYDAVVMDCQMPEMDGYEATRRIRAREASASPPYAGRLPIIAVTAHALQGDREQCLAAGMDDYLSKPIRPSDLKRVLERWLPAEGAAAAAPCEERPT
jgi:CheY-like chemotaxis protein